MKRKELLLGIAGVLLIGMASWNLLAAAKEQRAEVSIGRGYVVSGVKLPEGKYVVIHKDIDMKTGEACTFFYRAPYRADKEPVAKIHCVPTQGAVAKDFTMKSLTQPDGSSTIQSIQFGGSSEIHGLPAGS
jgi:hypothetical protein